jgi:formylglycine-generating enzyme required for sulfatase activity
MYKTILSVFFSTIITFANANNVQLTNVSVANNAAGTGKVVQFDLSWENSWRTSSTNNYDGVWVFFKFKDNDNNWYHLNFTGTNIAMPVGATYDLGNSGPSAQGVGIFIYRAQNGFGSVSLTGIKAGVQNYPGTHDIRGFAIEMVYIPQGSFYAGDTLSNNTYQDGPNKSLPFQITGNGANTLMGSTAGKLNDPFSGGYTGSLTGFPTGYNAFWMMKYELSVGAYRDFLNCLSLNQQLYRINATSVVGTLIMGSSPVSNNLEIAMPGKVSSGAGVSDTAAIIGCDADNDNIFNEATDGEWKAMINVNWGEVCAYLDWSGLRPMTELEFEKSCRGPLPSVSGEYAWGNTSVTNMTLMGSEYNITNPFQSNELVSNASSILGNCVYSNTVFSKIIRGGVFAIAGSSRTSSGAGYYGCMELSGNVMEVCVGTFTAAGRSYSGKLGDGILTIDGNANENGWPGVNGSTNSTASTGNYNGGNGVVSNPGLTHKGGSYSNSSIATSDRSFILIPTVFGNVRTFFYGIRGVR